MDPQNTTTLNDSNFDYAQGDELTTFLFETQRPS